ncbi:ribose 5-phosphate isomerase A [Halobacteriales archaeon QS_3_64_16]|nr:MAG: ribose 5-phosphate isomerase A [Halobacteriales archaeon QS_3_64_16]
MAKEFRYDEDGETISVRAESDDEVIERAREELDSRGVPLLEEDIREHVEVIPSPRRIKSGEDGVFDEQRRECGRAAAAVVESGMTVGLGTGSTTAWAVAEVGRKVRDDELEDIRAVATSLQSYELAKEAKIPIVDLDQVAEIDVAIDGADRYDPERPHVVKGGGASHAREKLIDTIADRLVITTDAEKAQSPLSYPVPLSVLPAAREVAKEWVRELSGDPDLRYGQAKDGPLFTANGNLVLDCDFGDIEDIDSLAGELSAIPAAQEHGLFVDLVDEIYVGSDDGVETITF